MYLFIYVVIIFISEGKLQCPANVMYVPVPDECVV